MGMKILCGNYTILSLKRGFPFRIYCVNGRLYHTHILCNEFYKEFHIITAEGTKTHETFLTIVQTAKKIEVNPIVHFYNRLLKVMQLIDLQF